MTSTISLGRYGTLQFSRDYWFANRLPTSIGAVDVEVDADVDQAAFVTRPILDALDQIDQIASDAQAYLREHAPDDFARAQPLRAPSLRFRASDDDGEVTFTIFYSGANLEDRTIYGVEFRDFQPFDVTIGD